MKTGPGKAAAIRGSCKRCDVVPARDSSSERHRRYDSLIREAIDLYQIPEALVRAVIKVESDYDPRVVSSAGARGLMQLMPSVCQDMKVASVHDPRENILGGTRLLRVLANRFDGDLVLTIAAYHAGAGAVERYQAIPPYETTQLYVRLVLKQYYRYKKQLAQEALAGL
ncbi:MAG: lytic transglycosylase domain-containing protein [Pseudomonadota bacterium]